jgi:hypothetical protein
MCLRLGRQAVFRALVLSVGTGFAVASASSTDASAETSLLSENQAAMTKMMAGMDVKPSGSADRDFAAMMIPHHQGAIDMAKSELRYGKNEQLRRIAQEIIVSQQQEIVVMQLALSPEPAASTAAPRPEAGNRPGAPSPAQKEP